MSLPAAKKLLEKLMFRKTR